MTRLDTDTTVHRIVGCILVSEGTEFNVEGHRRSKKRNGIRGSLPMIEVDRISEIRARSTRALSEFNIEFEVRQGSKKIKYDVNEY